MLSWGFVGSNFLLKNKRYGEEIQWYMVFEIRVSFSGGGNVYRQQDMGRRERY
jgi:hypothetical protein